MARLLTFILFACLIACTHTATQAQSSTLLEPKPYAAKLESTPDKIILDVRTPDEFKEGHIPGAINIDWNGNDFNSKVSELDKNKPVFLYCYGGGRSAAGAKALKKKGFTNVYDLEGGMAAWRKAGLPESK